jgi:hypothetical protein
MRHAFPDDTPEVAKEQMDLKQDRNMQRAKDLGRTKLSDFLEAQLEERLSGPEATVRNVLTVRVVSNTREETHMGERLKERYISC